jgi:FtsP/CotA-like multicopper oxidase with cupredoxin domain
MKRRTFLSSAAAVLAQQALAAYLPKGKESQQKADYTLRIEPCTIDIGKGVSIRTIAYNGQVPGPMLRLREGAPVSIHVTNHAPAADLVHWHGLATDSYNDGAMEEGSPMIQPGESLVYKLTPSPSGTRWYHTHASAEGNLSLGAYTGQFGFLLVEGKENPARYDQEFNLAIHHWEPSFVPMVEKMREHSANAPLTSGSDVGYKYATINGHMLGAGEPLRVKQGQKVLMRLLNASATENTILALPGHSFTVIAMDGNPVPNPQRVEVLSLAVAERIDAIVEMNAPGKWILGSTIEKEREMGLGVVVEYEDTTGEPMWKDPAPSKWDYSRFANSQPAPEPDKTYELIFRDIGVTDRSGFDTWTINGKAWPHTDILEVMKGKRYRLVFRNGSGDQHPMHLHRHTFEVTSIGDKKMSGLRKDVVNVMPLDSVAVDFVADNPGDTLMHCHQQLHMDFGFMQLVKYAG